MNKEKDNVMQHALNWWNELPIQDIYNSKDGWSNLVMKYYKDKTNCQDVTNEEILNMYKQEYSY
jgi:hypothetical protein